jgi:hypothetical protein
MRAFFSRQSRSLSTARAPPPTTPFRTLGIAAAAALGGGLLSRRMMHGADSRDSTSDQSHASLKVERQAPRLVRVQYADVDGSERLAIITTGELEAAAREQCARLHESRTALRERAASAARAEIDAVLAELQGPERISAFASWYYAYGTAYELLRVGMVAAAAALPSGRPAREAAADAVTDAVMVKYHSLVLRPSVVEPALRRAFDRAIRTAHADFTATVRVWFRLLQGDP